MNTIAYNRLRQRFRGVMLIALGLSPAILVAAIAICFMSIVGDVRRLVITPLGDVGQILTEIKDSARQTGEAIGDIAAPIASVNGKVADALRTVDTIPTQVAVPALRIPDANLPVHPNVRMQNSIPRIDMTSVRVAMPTVPGFTLSVDGLQRVKDVLRDNLNILGALNGITAALPDLRGLSAHVQAIGENARMLLSGTTRIGIKVLAIVILAALIVTPWAINVYVMPYVRWSFGSLRTGWKLLHSAPLEA